MSNNSLVFTAVSSQYLSITGNTSTNQQKFTIAFWFKRLTTAATQFLYIASDGTLNNRFEVVFNATDNIEIFAITAGTTILDKKTTATYIDTTSWHHLCIAVDTTQAVAANRIILYVDGVLVSSFSTNTIPAQNTNLSNNFASTYFIGTIFLLVDFFNGKFSRYYYIDGQQLAPSSFITGTPGLPKTYSGSYTGVFDFFLAFNNATSTVTLGNDGSGESNNWTLINMTVANQSIDYPGYPEWIDALLFPWEKPVWLPTALKAPLQNWFISGSHLPIIPQILYLPLAEPVRFLAGLRVWLQHFFEAPPRLLPTPTITGVMNARETGGKDAAEFGVQVYTPEPTPPSLQGANVSIYEVPAIAGGNVSIKD